MSIVTFDTYKQFKALTAAGFTEQQAKAIVDVLIEICDNLYRRNNPTKGASPPIK